MAIKKYTLEKFISERAFDDCKVMDALQDFGIVSDCCVTVADVALSDHERAMEFLSDFNEKTLAK